MTPEIEINISPEIPEEQRILSRELFMKESTKLGLSRLALRACKDGTKRMKFQDHARVALAGANYALDLYIDNGGLVEQA